MAPPGFHDAVNVAARREGQTSSEFIRQAIKVQLRRVDAGEAQSAASN